MSRFVGDARDFRRLDEPRVLCSPRTCSKSSTSSVTRETSKERAVRTWLADNEPNQVLARSLFEDGFAAEDVSNKPLGC